MLSALAVLVAILVPAWLLVPAVVSTTDNDADPVQAQLDVLALDVSREFEAARLHAEALARFAGVLQQQTGTAGYFSELRQNLQALLQATLVDLPAAAAVYAIWERDGVDGQDEVFERDREYGSNDQGRFASLWQRDARGEPVNRVLSEAELTTRPWRCQQPLPCLLGPYADQQERRVALVVPVLREGTPAGSYGVEMTLQLLDQRLVSFHRDQLGGDGYLALLGRDGQRVVEVGALPGEPSVVHSLPLDLADEEPWVLFYRGVEAAAENAGSWRPLLLWLSPLMVLALAWMGGVLLGVSRAERSPHP